MDSAYLLKRRAAVIARHEMLESVPGSGYHHDDAQAREWRDKGLARLSKRPMTLHHDGRYYVVGACVAVVREALLRFVAEAGEERRDAERAHLEAGLPPPEMLAQAKQALGIAERVANEEGDRIELPSNEWNACMYAVGHLKTPVAVVSSGVVG